MNPKKPIPSKTELLEWANSILQPHGAAVGTIEEMGSGVGYFLLLRGIHPGILAGTKHIKNPTTPQQYQFNLKLLNRAFSKLAIPKHIDVKPCIFRQRNSAK
jgi:hypothetical protein